MSEERRTRLAVEAWNWMKAHQAEFCWHAEGFFWVLAGGQEAADSDPLIAILKLMSRVDGTELRLPRDDDPQVAEVVEEEPTGFEPGSPRDVLAKMRRLEAEFVEHLKEVQRDNADILQDDPLDLARWIVPIHGIRQLIPQLEEMIAAGATEVPGDFMAKLVERVQPYLELDEED